MGVNRFQRALSVLNIHFPHARGGEPSNYRVDARREDHFAFSFFGFIDIPQTGIWKFETRSDDGSALYIDGVKVVNNDGSHSEVSAYGQIPLEKGLHPFKLLYFEDYEGEAFSWFWCAPGTDDYRPVPGKVLYYK